MAAGAGSLPRGRYPPVLRRTRGAAPFSRHHARSVPMSDETTGTAAGLDAADAPLGMPRILLELAAGRLGDADAVAVADWLLATAHEEPPSWAINRAVRIAGRAHIREVPRPAAWRRLVAALVRDTRLQPRPAGARAGAVAQHRRLYRAGGTEIDLEIGESRLAGRLRLLGQVTAQGPDLARAWAIADGPSGHLEAELDALGQFAFDGLVSGVHRLEIGFAC